MTSKRQYLNACAALPSDWLTAAASDPSPYMRPLHIALIRIALRQRSAA